MNKVVLDRRPQVARLPWEQQPGEPDMWFERFMVFKSLGLMRSIGRTYDCFRREYPEEYLAKGPSASWRDNSVKWEWVERAHAYDADQREMFRGREQEIAFERRVRRLQMINEVEMAVFAALVRADMANMDLNTARNNLPQLRMFFLGLVGMERMEFGGPADEGEGRDGQEMLPEVTRMLEKVWGQQVRVGGG